MKEVEILLDKLEQAKKATDEAITVLKGIIAKENPCCGDKNYDPDEYLIQWLSQTKAENQLVYTENGICKVKTEEKTK